MAGNSLRAYIELLAKCQNENCRALRNLILPPAEYILRNGREYGPVKGKCRKMAAQQCFMNATKMAADDPELTYVEGWATSEIGVPVEHAWCVDKDGKIYDPTWTGKTRPVGVEYFGVPFRREQVARVTLMTRVFGIFCQWHLWPEVLAELESKD
jgi:hypothetical protein